jgi:hypothetical protein
MCLIVSIACESTEPDALRFYLTAAACTRASLGFSTQWKEEIRIMPNTLVHLGVQGMGNRLISTEIDLKWVFLGCVIPDFPWILRRVLITLVPGMNLYDVTLYAAVQASLLFCILLSLVFALLSARPRLVFGILAANALIHLLLDTIEIKWGNGVILLAPLSWQPLSFGWVWPDSVLIATLSLVGLLVGVWVLVRPAGRPIDIRVKPPARLLAAFFLLLLYTLGPLALTDGPRSANLLSIATLQETEQRVGREIRIDRRPYQRHADGDEVITLADEPLRVVGDLRGTSTNVSLIGEFVDGDAIRIDQLHDFHYPWRDLASYVGLGLFALVWAAALIRERWNRQ